MGFDDAGISCAFATSLDTVDHIVAFAAVAGL